MAIRIFSGESDAVIEQLIQALRKYEAEHPRAAIDLYRHTPISVRVRIIDPDFSRRTLPERHRTFWSYLETLSDEVVGQIMSLTLVTPREAPRSGSNLRFEDTDPTGWWPPVTGLPRQGSVPIPAIPAQKTSNGTPEPKPAKRRKVREA